MRLAPPRVYADTSVFGGVFDVEYAGASSAFVEQVRHGRLALVTSVLVQDEVSRAPAQVQALFAEMLELAELTGLSEDAVALRDAYIQAGIVPETELTDASHVAAATVTGCFAIVSWNFRHIVHVRKVPLYNAVNTLKGYAALAICTPAEVIEYEEEEEGL